MMNESRYSPNGMIQRNGIAATSWQAWLVVASSMSEAHAGRANQRKRPAIRGTGPRVASPTVADPSCVEDKPSDRRSPPIRATHRPHEAENTTKAQDQSLA